jgi:hypothetical protein
VCDGYPVPGELAALAAAAINAFACMTRRARFVQHDDDLPDDIPF